MKLKNEIEMMRFSDPEMGIEEMEGQEDNEGYGFSILKNIQREKDQLESQKTQLETIEARKTIEIQGFKDKTEYLEARTAQLETENSLLKKQVD